MAGKRFLVVDDDADVITVVVDILHSLGHNAVPTDNYYSAIAIWSEQPSNFDALIVDYVLEDRTGTELAEFIWQSEPNRPVVLMTGFVPELLQIEDSVRGRLRFLTKPFTVAEFKAKVAEALGVG